MSLKEKNHDKKDLMYILSPLTQTLMVTSHFSTLKEWLPLTVVTVLTTYIQVFYWLVCRL